jgi:DNA-directed RNA polymerase subunit RPC12/RpoP
MGDLTIPLIMVGVFVVLSGVFAFLRLRPKAKPVETYYFFCPGCKRKFRYRADQVGHRAKCPQCDREWVFPPGKPSLRADGGAAGR